MSTAARRTRIAAKLGASKVGTIIINAPLPQTEAAIEYIWQCKILDTGVEPVIEELTRNAAQICGTPIALINSVQAIAAAPAPLTTTFTSLSSRPVR